MAEECVIDTTVLQKANATINKPPRKASLFVKRVNLLLDIQGGKRTVLISEKLLDEYKRKLKSPRNDYVKAFFELLADPDRCIRNWANWPSRLQEKARACRYPAEDDHVLRTAVQPGKKSRSTIITEEGRMLKADACIYREFKVHIVHTKSA